MALSTGQAPCTPATPSISWAEIYTCGLAGLGQPEASPISYLHLLLIMFAMVLRGTVHHVELADYTRLEELATLIPTVDLLLLKFTGRTVLRDEGTIQTNLSHHISVRRVHHITRC